MRRRRTPEHDLHRWVASYLARALQPPVFWTSIDHGAGKLTKTAAGNAKGRGCKAGIPDILVFVPIALVEATRVIGLELKAAKGQLSLPQISTQAARGGRRALPPGALARRRGAHSRGRAGADAGQDLGQRHPTGRMTAHTVRTKRKAKGACAGNMVRIMASVDSADFRLLQALANKREIPVAKVLRDAVWAYLLPLKGRMP
jgi:hypothetical protein